MFVTANKCLLPWISRAFHFGGNLVPDGLSAVIDAEPNQAFIQSGLIDGIRWSGLESGRIEPMAEFFVRNAQAPGDGFDAEGSGR